jgi:hypothetical protein
MGRTWVEVFPHGYPIDIRLTRGISPRPNSVSLTCNHRLPLLSWPPPLNRSHAVTEGLAGGPPFHLYSSPALLHLEDVRACSGLSLGTSSFLLLIFIAYIIIVEMLQKYCIFRV